MARKKQDEPLGAWVQVYLCRQGGVIKAQYYTPGTAPTLIGSQVPKAEYSVPMSVLPPSVLAPTSVLWMAVDSKVQVAIDGVGSIMPFTLDKNVTFGQGRDSGYRMWVTPVTLPMADINFLIGSSIWKFAKKEDRARLLMLLQSAMPLAYALESPSTPVGRLKLGTWHASLHAPAHSQFSQPLAE